MTTETKVEAVARLEITAHGRGEWSAHESAEGMFVLYAQHQSALDALRGEVERLRDQCICLQGVVGQYKVERLEAALKADAAERRLAEVREIQRSNYGNGVGLHLEMILWAREYDALTKESP
jgi:hypothetical protein